MEIFSNFASGMNQYSHEIRGSWRVDVLHYFYFYLFFGGGGGAKLCFFFEEIVILMGGE